MNHMGHMGNLKRKFFVSLALAIPIVVLSPMMGIRLPFQFTFPGSDWLVLLLATILFFYGGSPFLYGARDELKKKAPAMMTLIALGISVAYLYSLYAFVANRLATDRHFMDFFWELATLIVIMLLGHWIEMKAVGNAGNALEKMAELLPGTAALLREDGSIENIQLQDLQIGAKIAVRAGERIPADGVIVDGATTVNESMVTGEARDIAKASGDKVIGGSVNGSGGIVVKVTGTGESGYLAQVMRLVAGAQQEKSRAETISDRVARALFYVAAGAGIAAFVVWLALSGDINVALLRMVTVLVIACPHALGLAVPLVVARSTSLGAKNGLLVRKRAALEAATHVSAVMMDKTGTLTEGMFRVGEIRSFSPEMDENRVLALFSALEQRSQHPLAAGILREAKTRGLSVPTADKVDTLPGYGLSGKIEGKTVLTVSAEYLRKNGIPFDEGSPLEKGMRDNSVSFLVMDGQVVGMIGQGDKVKDGAAKMVADLEKQGIKPVMLTGDNQEAAAGVASRLGIADYHAKLLPEDKEGLVSQYRKKGHVVMMVGDGVNDAPALARADIGVAIGAGTDVAMDSADVVLVNSNPGDIPTLIQLAKNTMQKMRQNLWWGAGYNIVAIPLAAGVLAHWGIVLSPAAGAILMSLSTVVVAVNAMTLRIDKR